MIVSAPRTRLGPLPAFQLAARAAGAVNEFVAHEPTDLRLTGERLELLEPALLALGCTLEEGELTDPKGPPVRFTRVKKDAVQRLLLSFSGEDEAGILSNPSDGNREAVEEIWTRFVLNHGRPISLHLLYDTKPHATYGLLMAGPWTGYGVTTHEMSLGDLEALDDEAAIRGKLEEWLELEAVVAPVQKLHIQEIGFELLLKVEKIFAKNRSFQSLDERLDLMGEADLDDLVGAVNLDQSPAKVAGEIVRWIFVNEIRLFKNLFELLLTLSLKEDDEKLVRQLLESYRYEVVADG